MSQAGYLTLVQKSSEQNHKGILEMLHVNSYNTLPIFLTLSFVLGEPAAIGSGAGSLEPGFSLVFALLILSGCVLTYSQFLCAAVCSALTTSMVGVAKSVIQTILGFFTFGGVPFHPLNIIGQCRDEPRMTKFFYLFDSDNYCQEPNLREGFKKKRMEISLTHPPKKSMENNILFFFNSRPLFEIFFKF